MGAYEISLIIISVALLGTTVLPRILEHRPLSFPIVYVALGGLLFSLMPGAPVIDPAANPSATEHLTELVIIISLMGAGLKLDRPFSIRAWNATWRLLAIALPLTAGLIAVLTWGVLGLLPATAILLGAVIAPTDPVLAAGIGAGAPLTEVEEELDPQDHRGPVRFTLTSEAGLNDGLAFPLTNLAIVIAGATLTRPETWFADWLLIDVVYKIGVGIVFGTVIGQLMARFLFRLPTPGNVADMMIEEEDVMAGVEALSTTLLAYGLTELVHGYGFIAVFVAALVLRHSEWEHDYYVELHDFAVLVERLLLATVLLLFGGAIVGGLLSPLTWVDGLIGVLILFVIRPIAGICSYFGTAVPWPERAVVAFFGIRGVGSFYYLSYALAESSFREAELVVAAEELWALVGFVVLVSIVLHGITASPVMDALNSS